MKQKVKFTKMHGLGNDYIYVNIMERPLQNPSELSIKWSDRHKGIGSDGLVLIGRSDKADFSMRIFNADGSEAMMCGNASRCIGKYLYDKGFTSKKEIALDTLSGIKKLSIHTDDKNMVDSVTVDMGCAELLSVIRNNKTDKFEMEDITVNGNTFHGTAISMGNPHLVLFVEDIDSVNLAETGSIIEFNPMFPDRVNVEFACVKDRHNIRMRVWERGSGITQACGTGACATAVAAAMADYTDPDRCRIEMDGGSLIISWDKNSGRVLMNGSATEVFEGEIEINE